ncbi:MAG: hypothetical protein LUI05_06185 [Oscillospiraceae bacterium]|nr:hypothetical protein [Oscillospiraceae bacterium]
MLKSKGIIKNRNGKAYRYFTDYITNDFTTMANLSSSEYVKACWNRYQQNCPQKTNAVNGTIFEYIIETALYNRGILPMFTQASVAFVPNANFDILLYTDMNFPIGLSLKTSLRERYKQADLEAIALKYVHRRALNYLITLSGDEADNVKEKISNGTLLGINKVITADTVEFDDLCDELSSYSFVEPGKIDIIESGFVIKSDEENL